MKSPNNNSALMDDQKYQSLRENMIQDQIISRGIKDKKVLDALRKVPRHMFVDESYKNSA